MVDPSPSFRTGGVSMDDVLREFLTESNENLVRLEQDIVELERAPGDAALKHCLLSGRQDIAITVYLRSHASLAKLE